MTTRIRQISPTLITIVVLFALFLSAGLTRAASPPTLLVDESGARAAELLRTYDQPRHVIRYRYVGITLASLPRSLSTANDALPTEITLNLFPDVNFIGVVKTVKTNSQGGTTWAGVLKNKENGYFVAAARNNVLMIHVGAPDGVFEVSRVRDDLYRVIEIDQTALVDHAPDWLDMQRSHQQRLPERPTQENLGSGSFSAQAAASDTEIDVMVVYTAAARDQAGGTDAMLAKIDVAVEQANTAYKNSGANQHLRLVHTAEVQYAETGSAGTDLERLATWNDGYLDDVIQMRDQYGADLATVVLSVGNTCGTTYYYTGDPGNAYQVTRQDCMTENLTFTHELGHSQGADHDIANSNEDYDPPFNAYNHGYINCTKGWRTVMSYPGNCSSTPKRLIYLSNPATTYDGVPMGTNTTKNYQVLNETAASVANFRGASGLPQIPLGVTATDKEYPRKIVVSWRAAIGATSYEVWRSTKENSASAKILKTVTTTNYSDTAVSRGMKYFYWVKGKNNKGVSAFSKADPGMAGLR